MFLFHFEMLLWTLSAGLVIELFDANSKEFNECSRIIYYLRPFWDGFVQNWKYLEIFYKYLINFFIMNRTYENIYECV